LRLPTLLGYVVAGSLDAAPFERALLAFDDVRITYQHTN
jgi:hypothetical protein